MADEYKPQAWRLTGYYPEQYAKSMSALGIGFDYSDDDFDRYEAEFKADLAAHDAEVKADALDEWRATLLGYTLNFSSAESAFDQIMRLLKRDAAIIREGGGRQP